MLFRSDHRWGRLPYAARELESAASALPGRAEIHTGPDDRKHYLASSAPILHLATHAVADTVDANRSRILFSGEYLFRGEVAALPLAQTDLVTLSACDTEAGPLSRGEGVQSFSRALLAAGAHATVTTLWRVEDRATAEFMQIFYQHLANGEPKAEALRATKLTFLRQGGAHSLPLYWAAFVLNGDGQEPVSPVLSWWKLATAMVSLSVMAGIALGRRHRSRDRKGAVFR